MYGITSMYWTRQLGKAFRLFGPPNFVLSLALHNTLVQLQLCDEQQILLKR
jgi:hypothetical protein